MSFGEVDQIRLATELEIRIDEILRETGAYEKGVWMTVSVGAEDIMIRVVVPRQVVG